MGCTTCSGLSKSKERKDCNNCASCKKGGVSEVIEEARSPKVILKGPTCEDGVKISKLPQLDEPICKDWIPITHGNTTMRVDWCDIMEYVKNETFEYLKEVGCCSADGGCCGGETPETQEYANVKRCKNLRKANCPVGFMGTLVNKCRDAGEHTSNISPDDANGKADNWIDTIGQSEVNALPNNLYCIPAKQCPGEFDAGGQIVYQSTRIVLGDKQGKVRLLLGTYAQADSFDIYYGDVKTDSIPIWRSRELPTADSTTGLVSTREISKDDWNYGAYGSLKPCDNELTSGNGQALLYEVAVEFQYTPTDPNINFVTLVTQAPDIGTRWAYKMGCACEEGQADSGGAWNYCQTCAITTETFTAEEQTMSFTRSDCPEGFTPETREISSTASGKPFTSTVSQNDANQKAIDWLEANGQEIIDDDGECSPISQRYKNTEQCKDFYSRVCKTGETAVAVRLCEGAGKHEAESSEAANKLAQDELDRWGPGEADKVGLCTPASSVGVSNDEQRNNFTKNNCPSGYTGKEFEYVVAKDLDECFRATKQLANACAVAILNTEGQKNANNKTTEDGCTAINTAPNWTNQTPPVTNCSTSSTTNTGTGGSYAWREMIQNNPTAVCTPACPYGAKVWQRSASEDTALCGPAVDTTPDWQYVSHRCSCTEDSVTGTDGLKAFVTESDVNPNTSTPSGQRIVELRKASEDYRCANNPATWSESTDPLEGQCVGYDLFRTSFEYRCNARTGNSKVGTTKIAENSGSCGYSDVWKDCPANLSWGCTGTTKIFYECRYINDVYKERREKSRSVNNFDCDYTVSCCNSESRSATATRNDCLGSASCWIGSSVTYKLEAGSVCSQFYHECGQVDYFAQNAAAQTKANNEVQAYANANGTCRYSNSEAKTVERNRSYCSTGTHVDLTCKGVGVVAKCSVDKAYVDYGQANSAAETLAWANALTDANTKCPCINDVVCGLTIDKTSVTVHSGNPFTDVKTTSKNIVNSYIECDWVTIVNGKSCSGDTCTWPISVSVNHSGANRSCKVTFAEAGEDCHNVKILTVTQEGTGQYCNLVSNPSTHESPASADSFEWYISSDYISGITIDASPLASSGWVSATLKSVNEYLATYTMNVSANNSTDWRQSVWTVREPSPCTNTKTLTINQAGKPSQRIVYVDVNVQGDGAGSMNWSMHVPGGNGTICSNTYDKTLTAFSEVFTLVIAPNCNGNDIYKIRYVTLSGCTFMNGGTAEGDFNSTAPITINLSGHDLSTCFVSVSLSNNV